MGLSLAQEWAALDEDAQADFLDGLTDPEAEQLLRSWEVHARPEQRCPDPTVTEWPYIAGRGAGKTRAGAENTLDRSEAVAEKGGGIIHRCTFVGRTAGDLRDIQVEGESGIMACAELRGHTADYQPSKRRVVLSDLRTVVTLRSAEEPESLRGVQHHSAWADEPGAWTHKVDAQGNTAWSNLMFGLRLDLPPAVGLVPQVMATTTPKPIPLVIDWFVRAGLYPDPETGELRQPDPSLAITRGTLYDNLANLSPVFVEQITTAYGGTRLGAQEILGELLSAVEGALWQPEDIRRSARAPALARTVVAVDPPGSTNAEAGIVVAGIETGSRPRRRAYVLDDLSLRGRPEQWAATAVAAWKTYGAQAIVGEVNYGGDMVRAAIHAVDRRVPFKMVRASRGKVKRAEPVALLYQQQRVFHVGTFGLLEAQMMTYVEGLKGQASPDRMDALVWALTDLLPRLSTTGQRTTSATATGARVATGAAAATRRRATAGTVRRLHRGPSGR